MLERFRRGGYEGTVLGLLDNVRRGDGSYLLPAVLLTGELRGIAAGGLAVFCAG